MTGTDVDALPDNRRELLADIKKVRTARLPMLNKQTIKSLTRKEVDELEEMQRKPEMTKKKPKAKVPEETGVEKSGVDKSTLKRPAPILKVFFFFLGLLVVSLLFVCIYDILYDEIILSSLIQYYPAEFF